MPESRTTVLEKSQQELTPRDTIRVFANTFRKVITGYQAPIVPNHMINPDFLNDVQKERLDLSQSSNNLITLLNQSLRGEAVPVIIRGHTSEDNNFLYLGDMGDTSDRQASQTIKNLILDPETLLKYAAQSLEDRIRQVITTLSGFSQLTFGRTEDTDNLELLSFKLVKLQILVNTGDFQTLESGDKEGLLTNAI